MHTCVRTWFLPCLQCKRIRSSPEGQLSALSGWMSESEGVEEAKVLGREPSLNKKERDTVSEIMGLLNNNLCPRHPIRGPSPLLPSAPRPVCFSDPLGRPEKRRSSTPQTPPQPSPSSTKGQLGWGPRATCSQSDV
jgi:hypothetical protein